MTDINTVVSKAILLLGNNSEGKKLLGFLSNFFFYLNSGKIETIDHYIKESLIEPSSLLDSIQTYLQLRKIAVKMADNRLKLMDSLSTRFVVLDPFDYGHFNKNELIDVSKAFPGYDNEMDIEFLVSVDLLCERLGFQSDIPDEYGKLIFEKVDFETYHKLKRFLHSPFTLVSKNSILIEEEHLEKVKEEFERYSYLSDIEEE